MELKKVYKILNKIHDNQNMVNFESLIKFITSCEKIRLICPHISASIDMFNKYVYKVEIVINNIDCNLWLYFYDLDNVIIQQVFSYDDKNFEGINHKNKERMRLDFEPIRINTERLDEILRKYY